jgi:hypothetical protein
MKTAFRTSGISIFLVLFLLSGDSCKKEPTVTYGSVTVHISLIDYNYAPYTAGTWLSSTKIKIRYAGVYLDSLVNLYGAFNLPQSTPIASPCTAHLNELSHTFRIQNNVLNSLEISDPSGLRISYQINNTTSYFSTVSDSTTSYLSNTGCQLYLFPVR